MVLPICDVPKGTGSCRLIHIARWLNAFVRHVPCALDDIGSFYKLLQHGDLLCGLDLAQAYYHVDIHWRHRTLLGFMSVGRQVPGVRGPNDGSVFLLWFRQAIMRTRGTTDALCQCIDDFLGSNGKSCDKSRVILCIKFLADLGFALAPAKLRTALTQVFEGLGHVLSILSPKEQPRTHKPTPWKT